MTTRRLAPVWASLQDRLMGVLRAAKRPLVALGLGGAFDSRAVRLVRRRVFRTKPAEVVAVLDALEAAGVRAWLAGGWGLDGLVGRQTRPHTDIDVCIDVSDDGEARAVAALAGLGYEVTAERAPSGLLFPTRVVCRARSGRTIDLLLVIGPDRPEGASLPGVPTLEPGAVTTGRLAGREVGCLSAAVQLQARTGYVPQDRDRLDVALLCTQLDLEPPPAYRTSLPEPPGLRARAERLGHLLAQLVAPGRARTALLVPVPAAQEVVSACGGVGPGDPPAHVTVLYPFLPARRLRSRHREELARIVASVPAFTFRLAEMDSFPGTAYLAPRPAEPFIALTEMITGRWPAFPPYRGAFPTVIPHLTLGERVTAEDLVPTVAAHLPIDAEAAEVLLMAQDRLGSWTTRWRFPLGEGPAQ